MNLRCVPEDTGFLVWDILQKTSVAKQARSERLWYCWVFPMGGVQLGRLGTVTGGRSVFGKEMPIEDLVTVSTKALAVTLVD